MTKESSHASLESPVKDVLYKDMARPIIFDSNLNKKGEAITFV
jgi:hypothetical protein